MKLSSSTTNAQVLDLMMSRLGDRRAPKLRNNLLYELNNYIDILEQGPTLPWFLEKEHSFQLTAGVISYDLPSDFLREYEEGCLSLSYGGELILQTSKSAKEDLVYTDATEVQYALFGEKLRIAPVPDLPYDCVLEYLAASVEVADNAAPVSNVWLINAHNLVTFGALVAVADFHIQDPNMAQRFAKEEARAKDVLWRAHEARQHVNRDYKLED